MKHGPPFPFDNPDEDPIDRAVRATLGSPSLSPPSVSTLTNKHMRPGEQSPRYKPRPRSHEAAENERAKLAAFLSAFLYRYKSLADLATVIGWFARKFHVGSDLPRACLERPYEVTALTESILPFEVFELIFDDLTPVQLNTGDQFVTYERISFARLRIDHSYNKDGGPIAWSGVCVSQAHYSGPVLKGRDIFANRLFIGDISDPTRLQDGQFAGQSAPLARFGHLNQMADPEERTARALEDYPTFLLAPSFYKTSHTILEQFCDILNHKNVTVRGMPSEDAPTRADRRRINASIKQEQRDQVPFPTEAPQSYKIIIRNNTSIHDLSKDVGSGRHIRYTPRRRHSVEPFEYFKPSLGRTVSVPAHQRGGHGGLGPDYLLTRSKLLAALGIDSAPQPTSSTTAITE
jgi:hypothetical protein